MQMIVTDRNKLIIEYAKKDKEFLEGEKMIHAVECLQSAISAWECGLLQIIPNQLHCYELIVKREELEKDPEWIELQRLKEKFKDVEQ